MGAPLKMLAPVFIVSCLFTIAYSARPFPRIDELEFYSTEVMLSLVEEAAAIYAKEYYDKFDKRGSVSVYMQGALQSVYYDYDNDTYQIMDVNTTHCKATAVDISDFYYTPLYHGWLNKDPLVIGPSAPLFFALKNQDKIDYIGTATVRDMPCDEYDITIKDKVDNFTIKYYFAQQDWTTPYMYKKFTPLRIRITGMSARFTANTGIWQNVDQITDFAYFKPAIDDRNDLLPPVGIGCKYRRKSEMMPSIPKVFQFTAEIVNRITMDQKDDIEIKFEQVYYDYPSRLARVDKYSRKKGFQSAFYDFRGGAAFYRLRDRSCQISTLSHTELVTYDLGMIGRMMEPKEVLYLDGDFYSMGKRKIRGIECDAYESVQYNVEVMDQDYHKFVTTVYFTETITYVGVNANMMSRIPTFILINGWSTEFNRSLSLQYNIYGFNNVIYPPMYSSFGLERCYTKPDTKVYFVLVIEVKPETAAKMEEQDDFVISQLRTSIATHAKVPEHRIPFLKADYKTSGVFISGSLIERPPALLQFIKFDDAGPTVTKDPDLKVIADADTMEKCAYSCIDESDFPCKGFFFCNQACFLKSIDPFESEEGEKETDLGVCEEHIRVQRDSTTFREAYLVEALENLETAVLNESMPVSIMIPGGEETAVVRDIVLGDGPYTGVDAGDKPFTVSIEWRKLDAGLETVQTTIFAQTLTECYKRCKDAGSACSSFSFCPDSTKEDKQCLITPDLLIKGKTLDTDLIPDKDCNIYNPKYSSFYEPYPERVPLLPGDKSIRGVTSLEKCAQNCRMEKDFACRGFEFCRAMKTCTLHKKHILDFKPGETGTSSGKCMHYAARYIADYMDLGGTLIEDTSDVRFGVSLDECAKICSEELGENCKSFNYCPVIDYGDSSCALSTKLLRDDGITTTEKTKCLHFEKRDVVHDWDKNRMKAAVSGYTKKGFTGLVIGMLILGVILGALSFVGYSYYKARSSGDGLAVRFMKSDA